jgi:hypothetical protein
MALPRPVDHQSSRAGSKPWTPDVTPLVRFLPGPHKRPARTWHGLHVFHVQQQQLHVPSCLPPACPVRHTNGGTEGQPTRARAREQTRVVTKLCFPCPPAPHLGLIPLAAPRGLGHGAQTAKLTNLASGTKIDTSPYRARHGSGDAIGGGGMLCCVQRANAHRALDGSLQAPPKDETRPGRRR